MTDTFVVIACSKGKLDHPAKAVELYTGSLFRSALPAARSLVDDEHIRICSAKHGLVRLDEVLEPYDTWLGGRGLRKKVDDLREHLINQVSSSGWLPDPVVSLCPTAYTTALRGPFPGLVWPLEGATGIGYIRQRLARIAAAGRL